MEKVILLINILSFILVLILIVRSWKKGNILGFIYLVVYNYLIVGQAINISINLSEHFSVYYLYHHITREGHAIASILLFVITLFLFFGDLFIKYSNVQKKIQKETDREPLFILNLKMSIFYYMTIFSIQVLIFSLIVKQSGGLDIIFNSSRVYVSGITFYIVLLSFSCYPIFIKILYKLKINIIDIILYGFSIIMIMLFSRFIAIYQLFILILLFIYGSRNPKLIINKYKKRIVLLFSLAVVIFMVYGSYKHAINFTNSGSLTDVYNYYKYNDSAIFLDIDTNYKIGIESMSSFSGLFSDLVDKNKYFIPFDFGVTLIISVMKVIPSYIRTPIQPLIDYVSSDIYYNKSIIISPLTEIFGYFSYLGFIIYPLMILLIYRRLHFKIINSYNSYKILTYIIIGVYGISLIRGPFVNFFTYSIGQIVVAYLSIYIFRINYLLKKYDSLCVLEKVER